jgi:hypothetical protein
VTATNTTDFLSYIDTVGPLIIRVQGVIQIREQEGRPSKQDDRRRRQPMPRSPAADWTSTARST